MWRWYTGLQSLYVYTGFGAPKLYARKEKTSFCSKSNERKFIQKIYRKQLVYGYMGKWIRRKTSALNMQKLQAIHWMAKISTYISVQCDRIND